MLLAVLLLFDRPWGYPGETPVLLKFASNLLLLQAWLAPAKYFFSFNGVSWSLSVEAFFYAVFPFLLIGWHRRWWVALGASVLMALAIVRLGDGLDLPNYPYYDPRLGLTAWLPMVFPLVRLPEFLTGMAAAVLWFKMRDARPPRRSAILWSCTEIAALGVAYWALAKLPWVVPRVAQGPITTAWIVRCASGPLFAVLIFVFAFGRGYVSRLIGSRVMVFLGEISFSLYMTHEVLARELVARFPGLLFKGERWTGFLVFWTIEIVLSTALWLAVERPCRRWLIALFRARVSRPALAVEIGSVR
jgi:peptidoglycan/LPS O-acetylase OafA/YrhL